LSARAEEKRTAALAAAVFLFAAGLRLHGLASVFPVNDEFMQFYEALRPGGWREFLAVLARNPHHVLLDPLSTRLAAVFSASLSAMRFPSALAGALGAWLLCRLGAKEDRPGLGLAAGLLLSVSLLHLDWSRRADFYALLTLVSLWTTFDFFSVLDRPEKWPRLALSSCCFLLSHPYAVLMLAFQAAFAFWTVDKPRRRETFAAVAKAWLAAGAVFLPWFLFSTKSLLDASMFDFRGNPATLGLGAFIAGLPGALAQMPEAGAVPGWIAAVFASAYALGWASSLLGLRDRPGRLLRFSHAVLIVGGAAVVAADARYHYYLAHRQLLWLLPFYLVAVADGWARMVRREPGRRLLLASAVLGGGLLAASVTRWQEARTAGMNHLAAQLDGVLKDGDALAFENDQLAAGFLYGFDREAFVRIPDMRLRRGMMTYEFPPGFTATRGGRAYAVSSGVPCAQSERAWTVCGSVYETTVLPPIELAGR
jgi:hypothetical protein